MSVDDETTKQEQLRSISVLHAHHMFSCKRFQDAFDTFLELGFDELKVLSLFPSLIPPKAVSGDPPPNLTAQEMAEGLRALVKYLLAARKRVEYMPGRYNEVFSACTDKATILDTALLKALILTQRELSDEMKDLLKRANYCHVHECERFLKEHMHYKALVYLYQSKSYHKEALDLISKTILKAKNEESIRNEWMEELIEYLKCLDNNNLSLILEYSRGPLRLMPQRALAVFTYQGEDGKRHLFAEKVVKHIKAEAPDLLIAYLEHIVMKGDEKEPEFHNELILHYLDTVRTLQREALGSTEAFEAGSEPGLLGPTRKKLLGFLKKSKYYNPEKMLSRFPFDCLHHERAILLSRIGQHEQALNIYAHKLGNYAMAQSYCDENYDPSVESGRSVYLCLLKVYLQPPQGHAVMLEPALNLLHVHYKEISVPKALKLLPPDVPVRLLAPFLKRVFQDTAFHMRNNQVVKNLTKAENLQVKQQIIKIRANSVRITEDSACMACRKRLGTSVFAQYPNGVVVHLSCSKDRHICPVTGQVFSSHGPGGG